MSICLPSWPSCSIAAGRWRSAATSAGALPSFLSISASLAAAVVLPEPCRPASRITVGGRPAKASRESPPPITAVSSSWTIFTTCCPGVRLFSTSSPTARSRTRPTKSLTTRKLTSASSRARRTSRRAASTCASDSRPCPRRLAKMSCRRSESESNKEAVPFVVAGVKRSTTRIVRPRALGRQDPAAAPRSPTGIPAQCPMGGLRGELSSGSPGSITPLGLPPGSIPLRVLCEERVDERLRVEGGQVVLAFAEADELYGDAELALDGDHDAALGGAVEDQQDLADVATLAFQHAAHLLELLHEVGLGVEPAGGVDQEDVGALGTGGGEGVEGDRRRVGALLVADDLGADALAPEGELLGGCRTEGVGRRQDGALALLREGEGELAAGGGLAGAVDADDQDDARALRVGDQVEGEAAVGGADGVEQLGAEQLAQVDVACLGAGAEPLDQLAGGGDADVRSEQGLLQLVPGGVVAGAAGEQAGKAAGEGGAGAPEAVPEAPPWGDLLDLRRHRRGGPVLGQGDLGDGAGGGRRGAGVVADAWLPVDHDLAVAVGLVPRATARDQRDHRDQGHDQQRGDDDEQDLRLHLSLTPPARTSGPPRCVRSGPGCHRCGLAGRTRRPPPGRPPGRSRRLEDVPVGAAASARRAAAG